MSSLRADHAWYAKQMLTELLGNRFCTWFELERSFDMGGVKADLDGVIRSADLATLQCAVEIEARNYKQIRGAIMDLAWHPAPKKLLIVMKAQPQLKSTEQVHAHCNFVWSRLDDSGPDRFALVVLEGTGSEPRHDIDRKLLNDALYKLKLLKEAPPNG